MKSLIGLVPAMSGSIVYRGEAVESLPAHKRARLGMGYVPQGRDVFPRLTVGENVAVGAAIKGGGIPEAGRRKIVEAFPILEERWSQRAGTMSGGQQQQLAIGRVLIADPNLILLDEPSEGIQPNIVQEIGETLLMLNKEFGITLLLTEQHIKVARQLGDAFLMVDNGRVVANGQIAELDHALIQKHLTI
jgi:branched-chain amino acid transport system ATP-binding protein